MLLFLCGFTFSASIKGTNRVFWRGRYEVSGFLSMLCEDLYVGILLIVIYDMSKKGHIVYE